MSSAGECGVLSRSLGACAAHVCLSRYIVNAPCLSHLATVYRVTSRIICPCIFRFYTTIMPPKKSSKIKRQKISLDMKSKIIRLHNGGLSIKTISERLKFPRTTIQTIVGNKSKILNALESNMNPRATTIRKQQGIRAEVETMLAAWMNQRDVVPSEANLRRKAISLFNKLKAENDIGAKHRTFLASKEWLIRFKKKYPFRVNSDRKLIYLADSDDTADVDDTAHADDATDATSVQTEEIITMKSSHAEELHTSYSRVAFDIIQEEQLSHRQVFRVVETSLIWNLSPSKMLDSNVKTSQDYFRLMLCSNAEGDFKLKPFLVHELKKPKPLRNYVRGTLPLVWKSDSTGSLSINLFEEWFTLTFIPEVKSYCERNKIEYQALLFVECVSNHSLRIADLDSHVKVIFVPPVEAPDQHNVRDLSDFFKIYYLKSVFQQAAHASVVKKTDLQTFWDTFDLSDSVRSIAAAWNALEIKDIRSVWNTWCPQLFNDVPNNQLHSSQALSNVVYQMLEVANCLPGVVLTFEHVLDIMSLSNENQTKQLRRERTQQNSDKITSDAADAQPKQLTTANLIEAFNHLQAAMDIFENNDQNFSRRLQANKDIRNAYKCYRELYEKLRINNIN